MDSSNDYVNNFAPLVGKWEFTDTTAKYIGPNDRISLKTPFGLTLFEKSLKAGVIKLNIKFLKKEDTDVAGKIEDTNVSGRIVIGYNPESKDYYSIGLGGYICAYVLDKYEDGKGWRALEVGGFNQKLIEGKDYDVEVEIHGQIIILRVDKITVLKFRLPEPLNGNQTGLFAWGENEIEFSTIKIKVDKPKVFTIMEFTEPYDNIYKAVIEPICNEMGLSAYNAAEVYKPGIILDDIIEGLVESEIIIAEITPPNPNVFYELGFSHALKKKTILLAQRGRDLPFNISDRRTIFYDDTIKGKAEVEEDLRRHLKSLVK